MYCAKCGARLAEGAKKCDKCGEPVRARRAVASKKTEKRSETSFDYAPGNLNESDNSNEKTGDYVPADQEVKDPAFCEEPGENVDVQSIIRIAHGEEPASEKTGSDPEVGKRSVDSNRRGKLRYGAVTPLEKALRRIAEMRHHLEETAEEKRMNRHMERAAKHYEELGAAPTPILKSAVKKTRTRKDGDSRKSAAESAVPTREAKKTAARPAAPEHEGKKAATSPAAPEQEAKKAAAQAGQPEAEAGTAAADSAVKAAAIEGQLAKEREEKVLAQQEKQEKEAQKAVSEAETPDRKEATAEGESPAGEAAAEGEALDSEAAERKAVEEKILAEQKVRAEQKAAAQREAAEREAVERKAAEEKILAEKRARKALEDQERRDRERRARSQAAVAARTISEEEKQIQEARRIRRYYEEEPDALDLFLDKFGLTKETGVKIATLFLIVVLSLVYVIGRSRSGGSNSASPSGQGEAGETFSVSPESEEGDDSGISDDSDLPTGGGDFEDSQSDTDAQQEGPDTQEPTENKEP